MTASPHVIPELAQHGVKRFCIRYVRIGNAMNDGAGGGNGPLGIDVVIERVACQ